jgi:O-antigen/teichoic acid export membrane protein
MKRIALLAASVLTLWSLLIYPAWLFWSDAVWAQSLAALVICLLPAMVVLLWIERAEVAPERQLVAILGGTGIRMVVALGAGLALTSIWPEMFPESFWIWVAVFYLFILVVETMMLLKRSSLSAR